MFIDWNLFIHEITSWIVKNRHHSDTSKCRGFTIKNNAEILDPLRALFQNDANKNAFNSLTFGISINIKRIFSGKAIMNQEYHSK